LAKGLKFWSFTGLRLKFEGWRRRFSSICAVALQMARLKPLHISQVALVTQFVAELGQGVNALLCGFIESN
jgi:hypothetical protein